MASGFSLMLDIQPLAITRPVTESSPQWRKMKDDLVEEWHRETSTHVDMGVDGRKLVT